VSGRGRSARQYAAHRKHPCDLLHKELRRQVAQVSITQGKCNEPRQAVIKAGLPQAVLVMTLMHEMLKRDAKKGLATLCIGAGQGVALAIER